VKSAYRDKITDKSELIDQSLNVMQVIIHVLRVRATRSNQIHDVTDILIYLSLKHLDSSCYLNI
jgi:hypothetical protein